MSENPYRDHLFVRGLSQASTQLAEKVWDAGFAAGRAAATPDPPKGESHGKAEERERIVKELREAAHGGNRGQPGSFWVGWRAAARAIEEGWAEKPETDT